MKRLALVAAHFPPSNLAGVHRARLWAQHLEEFGWRPTIVTTHYDYYEEKLDWDLFDLVPKSLDVVRTTALPVRPIRIIGDIGVRAFVWHYRALKELSRRDRIDFVHVTIPSNFTALLGALLERSCGTPYGIDYQDPWVHEWPGSKTFGSKAWASRKLSQHLEPFAVRRASLITGVAPSYFEGVLERNPLLHRTVITAAMPIGFAERDFVAVRGALTQPSEFDPADGMFHIVYAGALLPQGHKVLEALFAGLRHLATQHPSIAARLRVHFIGTGKSPDDRVGYNVMPIARGAGVEQMVTEHPHRMGYVAVLRHLVHASAVLVIGSTEAHYTPSKVFQSVQSRRPVLALLHEASTAVEILRSSRAGEAITLTENRLPAATDVALALRRIVDSDWYDPNAVDWAAFEQYSARESARALAAALDQAMERGQFGSHRAAQ